MIIPLFSILFFSCAETKKITFVEYKQNENKIELKKNNGYWSRFFRHKIFLDMLTNKLIKDFQKKKIITEYNYIGKVSKDSSINIKSILNEGYDAFIIFKPKDTSKIKIDAYRNNNSIYLPSSSNNRMHYQTNTRKILYKQACEVSVYIPKNGLNSVWNHHLE
jgi:serine/threonine-protein kinase RIO1